VLLSPPPPSAPTPVIPYFLVARRARARAHITLYYVYDQRASPWRFGSTLFQRGREGEEREREREV